MLSKNLIFLFSLSLFLSLIMEKPHLSCQVCKKVYKSQAWLTKHIGEKHPNSFLNNNVIFQLEENVVNVPGNLSFIDTFSGVDLSSDSINSDDLNESILNNK